MKIAKTPLPCLALTLCVMSSGCAKDPSKDVPKAAVEIPDDDEGENENAGSNMVRTQPSAHPVGETPRQVAGHVGLEAPAGGVALQGDIVFVGSKVTGSHACKMTKWSGFVMLPEGKLDSAMLAFTIDMNAIEADYDAPTPWSHKLAEHLRSADFFDTAKHPISSFHSTAIKFSSKDGISRVMGILNLHGTSKLVTFPAHIRIDEKSKQLSGKAEFSINRKEFGIAYDGKPDDLIRENVILKIDVRGKLP